MIFKQNFDVIGVDTMGMSKYRKQTIFEYF